MSTVFVRGTKEDQLIEIGGDIEAYFTPASYGETLYLAFSDGTLLEAKYQLGICRINFKAIGTARCTREVDPGTGFTDIAILIGDIKWVVMSDDWYADTSCRHQYLDQGNEKPERPI